MATDPSPVEAGFVKNLLEAEGIRAFLADENTAGMFWQYGNAMGWVKLRVQAGDVPRANEIIGAHQQTLGEMVTADFISASRPRRPRPVLGVPGRSAIMQRKYVNTSAV